MSTGTDPDDIVSVTIGKLLADLPEKMELAKASSFHTSVRNDGISNALTVVLFQEVKKFNRLLAFVRMTLEDLQQAILGEIVMSGQLEQVYSSVYVKRVPEAWAEVG
jgi:dynein heavy chain